MVIVYFRGMHCLLSLIEHGPCDVARGWRVNDGECCAALTKTDRRTGGCNALEAVYENSRFSPTKKLPVSFTRTLTSFSIFNITIDHAFEAQFKTALCVSNRIQ